MTFQHRAGVSPYASPCGLAQACVFAKQLLGPLLCGLVSQAPLLPKLRGHFAEFLGDASPAGLGILSPSTCVGLRYGCMQRHSGFSRHTLGALPYSYFGPLNGKAFCTGVFPPARPRRLHRSLHSRLALCACVPAVLTACSTGISTCLPSATPFGLALGPDSPRADQLYPGDLGYSAWGIPTPISLLIPAFSLPVPPPLLSVRLRRNGNAPLPKRRLSSLSRASAACFSPGHFRRRASRPVSYYALFQCMAASEPTSWLSLKPHILIHLTRTLGP